MRGFRLFFLFGVILLAVSVLLQPTFSHALYAPAGARATVAPTATPTIAVPTAFATQGNVLTESNLGSPSSATHDMIACCIEQNVSATAYNTAGWFPMTNANNWDAGAAWLNIMGHCVQSGEGSSSSTTFTNLTNSGATVMACDLLRNTACGQDTTGTTNNTGAGTSATVTYPAITTASANTMLLYCATSGVNGHANSMSTNPAGLVVDAFQNGVSNTSGLIQIGHIPQATAATVPSTTGTIANSDNNAAAVGAVATLH